MTKAQRYYLLHDQMTEVENYSKGDEYYKTDEQWLQDESEGCGSYVKWSDYLQMEREQHNERYVHTCYLSCRTINYLSIIYQFTSN